MSKRSTKFYRKNEKEVMERLGFEPTRNSGATWLDKGDGQSEHCLCELKSTDKMSYKLEQQTLHTLELHAIEAHKLPVFALQFLNTDEIWLAVKETDIESFKELVRKQTIEELKEKECNYFRDKEEAPDCFGIKDDFEWGDECVDCLFYEKCEKAIDKQKENEYNNDKDLKKKKNPTKNAKANLLAREKIKKQREKERKENQKAWKKRLSKKE